MDFGQASPQPKSSFGLVMVTCYVTMAPKAEAYEYACPTCGTRTHYPRDKYRVVKQLESLRAAAARYVDGWMIPMDTSVLNVED